MTTVHPLVSATLALSLLLVGCQDDEIRVYEAPKAEAAPAEAKPAPSPGMGWVVPQGWRQVPGAQPLRVATFIAGEADHRLEISVASFAGAAGGILANVNRWREQIGLPPIDDATLADQVTPLTTVGGRGFLVRLAGTDLQHQVLAAILPEHGGATWFVKATGPAARLDQHGDALRSFAMSFDPSAPPAAAPDPQPAATAEPAQRGVPAWDVPTHWIATAPTSSLVAAAFTPGSDSGAQVTVTPLAGEAGGLLANLNRWRSQVGLPPVTEVAAQPLTTLTVGDGSARIVDLVGGAEGTAPARALIVALVAQPGSDRTWYVRLAGPAAIVATQREAFLGFVRSIRFATPSTETK